MTKKVFPFSYVLVLLFLVACSASNHSKTIELYVSVKGNNSAVGTQTEPLATLPAAVQKVRALRKNGNTNPATIYLRAGRHQLDETLLLGMEDGRISDNKQVELNNYGAGESKQTPYLTITAFQGESPVVSAGVLVDGWNLVTEGLEELPDVALGNVWVADIPKNIGRFYTLFDENGRLKRARGKGFVPTKLGDKRTIHFPKGALKTWDNLEDVEINIRPNRAWVINMLPLASVDEDKLVAKTGVSATYDLGKIPAWIHTKEGKSAWVENVIEVLDEPGEWVVNTQTGKIYLWPANPEIDGSPHGILAPSTSELICIEGEILYYGGYGKPFAVRLKENMTEIAEASVPQIGLDDFREGAYVFKRNDIYYMIYPDNTKGGHRMRHAISENPMGPWEAKGVFLGKTNPLTTHGSCVEFKGQWYLFYHNAELSGGIPHNRSVCFDPIYFNEDGSIKVVKQSLGVEFPTFHNDINFNGMFGTLPAGEYKQADLMKKGIQPNAITSIEIPAGYVVECFEKDKFKGKSWRFKENRIDLNAISCNDAIASLKISKTEVENLVKNPSFVLSTQKLVKYWRSRSLQCQSTPDKTAKGYYSLKYEGKGAPGDIAQGVSITPNTKYELSVMLKIESGAKGKVVFDTKETFDETCKFELDASSKTGEWVEFKGEFYSGDATNIQLRCTTTSDFNGTCYWDNVVLIEK